MLQCVACVLSCTVKCRSALQCVAVCYSVLQCDAGCCSVLRCVTVRFILLQYVAVCGKCVTVCVAVCCNDCSVCSVLQCVAGYGSVSQCVTVCAFHHFLLTPSRPLTSPSLFPFYPTYFSPYSVAPNSRSTLMTSSWFFRLATARGVSLFCSMRAQRHE